MAWRNRIRAWLGLRPVLVLYVLRGNALSEFVAAAMRTQAEAAGYHVRERRV